MEILEPLIVPLYPLLDAVLGWTMQFGGVWGIVIIGVLTGLGVNLFQKFFSKQKLLGKCKADLDKLKKRMKEAKKAGDDDRHMGLLMASKRVSGKYMWNSLKPSVWTVPPVVVLVMWTWVRLGFDPVPPGREMRVTACFENEAKGIAHAIPSDGLKLLTPPVVRIGKYFETPKEEKKRKEIEKKSQADGPVVLYKPWTWFNTAPPIPRGIEAAWTVKADKPGEYTMLIRCPTSEGMKDHVVLVPVIEGRGTPPQFMTSFLFDTPDMDHMQAVLIDVDDSMPPAWWNLKFQWMGLYIALAVIFGVGFRFALRVN
jgi:uncharacterized membrane protein (DUF106 family)